MGDGGWVLVDMSSAACVRRASGRDGGRDGEIEKMREMGSVMLKGREMDVREMMMVVKTMVQPIWSLRIGLFLLYCVKWG